MKRRILLLALSVVVLGGFVWLCLRRTDPEPVYKGKPLSAWLEIFAPPYTNHTELQMTETEAAIREMGTNAIPPLLQLLRTPDSRWKKWVVNAARKQHVIPIRYTPPSDLYYRAGKALEILGPRAESAVPELINIYERKLSQESQTIIGWVLAAIGPAAKAAVPALVRGAASTNDSIRVNAIIALGRIHADPGLAVPVLINALQDPFPTAPTHAAQGLAKFGPDAKAAVPALLKIIETNKSSPPTNGAWRLGGWGIGVTAVEALRKIDPEAAAKTGF